MCEQATQVFPIVGRKTGRDPWTVRRDGDVLSVVNELQQPVARFGYESASDRIKLASFGGNQKHPIVVLDSGEEQAFKSTSAFAKLIREFQLRGQLSTGASSSGQAGMIGIGLIVLAAVLAIVCVYLFGELGSQEDPSRGMYKITIGSGVAALISLVTGIRKLMNASAMKKMS